VSWTFLDDLNRRPFSAVAVTAALTLQVITQAKIAEEDDGFGPLFGCVAAFLVITDIHKFGSHFRPDFGASRLRRLSHFSPP
jgi:hypothetical protein